MTVSTGEDISRDLVRACIKEVLLETQADACRSSGSFSLARTVSQCSHSASRAGLSPSPMKLPDVLEDPNPSTKDSARSLEPHPEPGPSSFKEDFPIQSDRRTFGAVSPDQGLCKERDVHISHDPAKTVASESVAVLVSPSSLARRVAPRLPRQVPGRPLRRPPTPVLATEHQVSPSALMHSLVAAVKEKGPANIPDTVQIAAAGQYPSWYEDTSPKRSAENRVLPALISSPPTKQKIQMPLKVQAEDTSCSELPELQTGRRHVLPFHAAPSYLGTREVLQDALKDGSKKAAGPETAATRLPQLLAEPFQGVSSSPSHAVPRLPPCWTSVPKSDDEQPSREGPISKVKARVAPLFLRMQQKFEAQEEQQLRAAKEKHRVQLLVQAVPAHFVPMRRPRRLKKPSRAAAGGGKNSKKAPPLQLPRWTLAQAPSQANSRVRSKTPSVTEAGNGSATKQPGRKKKRGKADLEIDVDSKLNAAEPMSRPAGKALHSDGTATASQVSDLPRESTQDVAHEPAAALTSTEAEDGTQTESKEHGLDDMDADRTQVAPTLPLPPLLCEAEN